MTSVDWRRLESLFDRASALPPEACRALIEEVRADDPEMADELESLVRFGTDGETRIRSAVGAALAADTTLGGANPGDQLGNYRLLEVLGRGGLSTVYLAERHDREFELKVAVKLIRRELDSDITRERLQQERQILASLEHANIARLLDGGTSDSGQPYFVMEHVEGTDLESHCQDRDLSVASRLRLFLPVCAAVEHAHRRLVIHRDLKPDNILVTAEGVPKLLDFGIAKPLEQAFANPMVQTAPHLRLLTIAFASPEQIRGEVLTTATDVYSLGVILYRLLSGHHPYPVEGRESGEVARQAAMASIERPSRRVEAEEPEPGGGRRRSLRRRLEGDLDTIVLKALHQRPERRYPSVNAFADDLDRHLRGLPVSARGDSIAYRVGAFLRRHRLASALVMGLVASTVFFIVSLAHERNVARQEATKVAQVSDLLVGLFESSDPNQARGEIVTARELLDRGAERIESELATQPVIQATMMGVMGRAYSGLGLLSSARPLLEDALAQRIETLGDLHLDVASSRNALGELLVSEGDFEAAEGLFQQALDVRLKTLGNRHRDTWTSLNNLAVAHAYQGDVERAEPLFRRVLNLRRRHLGEQHPDVATSLNNLADVVDRRGDSVAAEALYQEALALKRSDEGADSPGVALVLNNLARLAENRGDDRSAKAHYEEALALNRRLVEAPHMDIAFGLDRLAAIARRDGRLEDAEAFLREGLSLHASSEAEPSIQLAAMFLESLAEVLLDSGRSSEAVTAARDALARREAAYPDGHWRVESARSLLGGSLLAAGLRDEAEPLLISSHQQLVALRSDEHPATQDALRRREMLQTTAH